MYIFKVLSFNLINEFNNVTIVTFLLLKRLQLIINKNKDLILFVTIVTIVTIFKNRVRTRTCNTHVLHIREYS